MGDIKISNAKPLEKGPDADNIDAGRTGSIDGNKVAQGKVKKPTLCQQVFKLPASNTDRKVPYERFPELRQEMNSIAAEIKSGAPLCETRRSDLSERGLRDLIQLYLYFDYEYANELEFCRVQLKVETDVLRKLSYAIERIEEYYISIGSKIASGIDGSLPISSPQLQEKRNLENHIGSFHSYVRTLTRIHRELHVESVWLPHQVGVDRAKVVRGIRKVFEEIKDSVEKHMSCTSSLQERDFLMLAVRGPVSSFVSITKLVETEIAKRTLRPEGECVSSSARST